MTASKITSWPPLAAAMVATMGVMALVAIGPMFAIGEPPAGMPILLFAGGFAVVGLLFLAAMVRADAQWMVERGGTRPLTTVFMVGLTLRLVLSASEPVLEVDYNRYLWDGGLAARGYNPFSMAPAQIIALPYDDMRVELSKAASPVFERISYPELKTIYPPVAQGAFALAHLIEPWSLAAWRGVAISAEIATFLLLIALLTTMKRSPLYVALYWWNPLVLKEAVNSAHMDVIVTPFVLGALLLSSTRRHFLATASLGLAVGAKLWPIMLVPLVLRPLLAAPVRLSGAICLFCVMMLGMAAPVVWGGIDQSSGFVGFAKEWRTNSALFPLLTGLVAHMIGDGAGLTPGLLVRFVSAAVVAALALAVARTPLRGTGDLVARAYLVVTVLLLLSPAQFPWYVLWILPLACLRPGFGWHVAAALLPLYYAAFHFLVRRTYDQYETVVVWLIWGPVWLALLLDIIQRRRLAA